MIRIFLAAAVAWLALVPFDPAWADATRRPAVEEIVRLFETVVFGSELDPKLASKAIAKWQAPVRLAIQGKPGDRHLEFLGRHAATLSDLTGLSIELAKPGEAANITVAFVPRAKMSKIQIGGVAQSMIERLAAPGGCYFISWQKPVGTIIGAAIVVNTDRDMARINHCLLEELTQSLGFPNDTDVLRPSIFSDHDYLHELSRPDVIVVRTLYDPRLNPAMPKAEALKIVPAIVRELNARLP
ncbi:MAG: DUF2927 domain-containing protein [Pseudomonadota bacterium]